MAARSCGAGSRRPVSWCEDERFRPWLLLDRLDDLPHLGSRLKPDGTPGAQVSYRELDGPGELRFLVNAECAHAQGGAVARRQAAPWAACQSAARPRRRKGAGASPGGAIMASRVSISS